MSTVCPVCSNPVGPHDVACPQCGFKLLGTTQRFEPVKLTDEPLPASAPTQAAAVLHVVRGPQTGISYQLKDALLSIGRSPQCDIFLNDMTVSREHASVEPAMGGYVISDKNSFNGVWVNNESIVSRQLKAGDVIQIGAFCLVYQED